MIDLDVSVEQLTRQFLRFDTINPPGNEAECIRFAARFLEQAGFHCDVIDHGQARASLVATRDLGDGLPVCFSGHLDTVPLGQTSWSVDPFAGEIKGDKLYGRGSSDMKGGVAAFFCAVLRVGRVKGGIVIILTAGEETGCDGARWLTERNSLPDVGAMIVGESTDNQVYYGHKGVLWILARTLGKTAHGAAPELGDNAIRKSLPLLAGLAEYDPAFAHPEMGKSTANVGTVRGGININSVPDVCEMTIDIRTVPGLKHDVIRQQVAGMAGSLGETETLLDLEPVWTPRDHPWCSRVAEIVFDLTRTQKTGSCVNYFTDAAVLKPALSSPPTVILGPGSLDQPHTTDEWVSISKLKEAVTIYQALLSDWSGSPMSEAARGAG